MNAARSVWAGLPTILEERDDGESSETDDTDVRELHPIKLALNAGFALSDSSDPRYQAVVEHRRRFGTLLHRAVSSLSDNVGSEDHIDAVIGVLKVTLFPSTPGECTDQVLKAIDVYLLGYAASKASYLSLRKNYTMARE